MWRKILPKDPRVQRFLGVAGLCAEGAKKKPTQEVDEGSEVGSAEASVGGSEVGWVEVSGATAPTR